VVPPCKRPALSIFSYQLRLGTCSASNMRSTSNTRSRR